MAVPGIADGWPVHTGTLLLSSSTNSEHIIALEALWGTPYLPFMSNVRWGPPVHMAVWKQLTDLSVSPAGPITRQSECILHHFLLTGKL